MRIESAIGQNLRIAGIGSEETNKYKKRIPRGGGDLFRHGGAAVLQPEVVEWIKSGGAKASDISQSTVQVSGDNTSPFISSIETAYNQAFNHEDLESAIPPEHVNLDMMEPESDEFYGYLQSMFGIKNNFWKNKELKNQVIDATTPPHINLLAIEEGAEIPIYTEEAKKIDEYFYTMFGRRFNLPTNTQNDLHEIEKFFFEQQKYASMAFNEYLRMTMPSQINFFDERTEVSLNNRRPSDLLHYLLSSDISREMRFELQRQLVLSHVSAEIAVLEYDSYPQKVSKMMMDIFGSKFFDGKIGELIQKKIFAYHSKNTNEAFNVGEKQEKTPENTTEREYPFKFRIARVPLKYLDPITGKTTKKKKGIETHVSPKPKERVSAILKTLRRANDARQKGLSVKGILDPAEQVRDIIRIRFIVNGPDDDRTLIKDRVRDILRDPVYQRYIGQLKKFPDDIIEDNSTNQTKGQSKRYTSHRDQIHLEGLSRYIEIQYFTTKEYLDSIFDVGENQNGVWNGASWELMKIKELMDLSPVMLPKIIYSNNDEINQFMSDHYNSTAVKLLTQIHGGL